MTGTNASRPLDDIAPDDTVTSTRSRRPAPPLFPITVFCSAALVFLVEPMVGKLLLPLLGGAPAVWNTSMAFFQIALLLGYAYAHWLQRVPQFRVQVLIHGVVLAAAALTLPLHVSGLLGQPNSSHPVLWLLGTLILSIGAPFAALSATAPLVQAWFARTMPLDPATGQPPEPYALYAASNLGSLLSLIAYPVVVEPLLHLSTQRLSWSFGYAGLAVLMIALGLTQKSRLDMVVAATTAPATERPSWLMLGTWVGLAALPSSLMLGVTTFLSTDVATTPFLWVAPLALYLLTFILAFASKPPISVPTARLGQALMVCLCLYFLLFRGSGITLQLVGHLAGFFIIALLCHMTLAQKRPAPEHLTLYYLCISLGGVIGGSFNAFLAPLIFPTVVEYPLVLALTGLAQPWNGLRLKGRDLILTAAGIAAAAILFTLAHLFGSDANIGVIIKCMVAVALVCVVLLRNRGVAMTAVLLAVAFAIQFVGQAGSILHIERSFFGVSKVVELDDPVAGHVREMVHGTTLHGAQSLMPGQECRSLTYYSPESILGETMSQIQTRNPSVNAAIVGLGAGAMAAYVRPTDHLTYYEIDPVVVKLASDPRYFTYLSRCAKAPVNIVTGDARLTLAPLPQGKLDLLMVDAFSSNAVPAHLLTVEAVRMYLSKLDATGVIAFHLSNRHLELTAPVIAAVREAGGVSLEQTRLFPVRDDVLNSSSVVVLAARTPAALAAFRADKRWETGDSGKVPAWTDDYMNLIGALLRKGL